MAISKLLLIVGGILLAVAGVMALGVLKGPVEALALFGFACWCWSGAVAGTVA